MIDVARFLRSADLSEGAVRGVDRRSARSAFAGIRSAHGLSHRAVALLTEPSGNIKLSHSGSQMVAGFGLNLLPADASGEWNTCRYATPGCRAACLATSGQAGMERRSGRDRIFRARRAKLAFLMSDPAAFFALLLDEVERLPQSKWAVKGWTVSLRLNVLSDIPWETFPSLGWFFSLLRDLDVVAYDYTAWPSSRRPRASAVYLVDSVKETHTDAAIRRMERPVVVFDVARGRDLPAFFLGRPVVDADASDARFLDAEGTVRGLRYKHVATTSKREAVASGFVKAAA